MIELPIAFAVLVTACFLLANNPRYNGSGAVARARRDADLERWLNQDGDAPKRKYTARCRNSKRRAPARR